MFHVGLCLESHLLDSGGVSGGCGSYCGGHVGGLVCNLNNGFVGYCVVEPGRLVDKDRGLWTLRREFESRPGYQ